MPNDSVPSPGREPLHWLWVLMGVALLSQVTVNLVRPTTTYKLLAFDADTLTVGLVTALYALLPLVLAMNLGAFAQRVSSLKPLLIGGCSLVLAGAVVISWAPDVTGVAVGTAVLGMGHLGFTIAGQSAIARYTRASQMDKGFGWFEAGFAAGQMIGPLLGGLMLGAGQDAGEVTLASVERALWIGTAATAPAILLLALAYRTPARHRYSPSRPATRNSAGKGQKPSAAKILRVRGVPSHVLASLAVVAVLDILAAFLPLVGESLGVAPAWIGVLLALRAAATILSRFLLSVLRRRLSREILVVLSLWGSMLPLAGLPLLLEHPWASAGLMVVAGFFLGLGQPLTMSLVAQSVPPAWGSSALALRLVANRLGQVASPLAAGAVAAPLGASGAIWLSCAVLSISGTEKLLRWSRTRGNG